MKTLNIAICDDDIGAVANIDRLINRYFENKTTRFKTYKFSSGSSLLQSNIDLYDIVFLDIKINEESGLNVAQELNSLGCTAVLMLVSQYHQFLPDGYRVRAFRYLLKQSIDAVFDIEMDAAMEELNLKKRQFTFQVYNDTFHVDYDDIIYFMSSGHKIKVVTATRLRRDEFTSKLDKIEQEIDNDVFIRIAKSYLVNVKHIKSIRSYKAYLDTGEELSVTRNGYSGIEEKYIRIKQKLYGIHN